MNKISLEKSPFLRNQLLTAYQSKGSREKRISFLFLICLLLSITGISQNQKALDLSELDQTLVQDFSQEFAFSVIVEIDDVRTFYHNYGYIDMIINDSTDNKTLFNIASITKSITAVGIMKLVEQGKLSLEDRLGQFFQDVPREKDSISIQTLLSHRSGLKQNYPLEGISESEVALRTILDQQLEFKPESGFLYSNQNYQLLALIMEEISQVPYEDFIKTEVLLPLNMQDTYQWVEVSDQHQLAYLDKKIQKKVGKRNWGWIGATGIFSTTEDLSRYWNGIYREGFLSKESIDIIFDTYHQTQSGIQIGLGFFKSPNTRWGIPELWTRGTESWGHNGVIRYFPDRNTLIVVLTDSGEFGKNKMTGNRVVSDLVAGYLFE